MAVPPIRFAIRRWSGTNRSMPPKNRSIAVLVFALLISLTSASQGFEPARFVEPGRAERVRALLPEVERTYREFAISNQIPGLAFGVVLDGELILSGSYGVSQIHGKVPANPSFSLRQALG